MISQWLFWTAWGTGLVCAGTVWLVFYHFPVLPAARAPVVVKRLTILIPARNEADNIAILLRALKQQTLKPLEVIVIDDQSSDRTAEIAAGLGAAVISLKEKPAGWLGKNYALWQGSLASKGDFFLFLDADTIPEPDFLAQLNDQLQTGRVITIIPYHQIQKAYENGSAMFNLVSSAVFDAFRLKTGAPASLGIYGPCFACSRSDYFSIDGHRSVKHEVVEDVCLAAQFRTHHIPVQCFYGKGSLLMRMYPGGIKELLAGWIKNIGAKAAQVVSPSLPLIALWLTGLVCSLFAPLFLLFAFSLPAFFACSLLYAIYTVSLAIQFRRLGNFSGLAALFFPVCVLFFLAVFFVSLYSNRVLHRVSWKGREIDVG